MPKTLLILTAGSWQLPVVRSAQRLGLRVVMTDQNASAPAFALADEQEVVDARDREAIVAIARRHRIDGVIAEQTDVGVCAAAYVAEQLGLPGIGYETSLAATNKFLMRGRCRVAGISGPQYRRVMNAHDAVTAADEIGYPVVLKPLDAQSSRGVAKLNRPDEVAKWFAKASGFSSDGSVLVEEMLRGTEASIEGFVANGIVYAFAICEKVKSAPPYSFDLRLTYPASFERATIDAMFELNEKVVRAIGIPMGITHAEYILTADGPRLLEIAARGCGAGVASQLIPAMTGVDLIGSRIRQALGESVAPKPTRSLAGLLEFLMLPEGTLRRLDGLDEARNVEGVIDLGYFVKPGDVISGAENGGMRPGYLLAAAEDRATLTRIADKVRARIHYEVN